MSQTDSFIDEVTEEVRRDKLFAAMKKYGWVGVLGVLVIVGGAGWREWTRAQEQALAQATGDALLAAISKEDSAGRVEALSTVDAAKPEGRAAVQMLKAAEFVREGKAAEAVAAFALIASVASLPQSYRDIAGFKALLAAGDTLDDAAKKLRLEAVIQAGGPLRLLAEEQLAIMEASAGETEAALERSNRIVADAEASQGLRARASRLIVALGGTVELPAEAGAAASE